VQPPASKNLPAGTFGLNTGRVRDHWHTMTRTGKAARLSAHMAEPYAEIHPSDAVALGIRPAGLVTLSNEHGSALVRALITDRQQRGQVFVPMHWTAQFAASGRVDVLVPGKTDPVSGQPALKMAQVDVAPAPITLYGFLVSAHKPQLGADYWALAPANGGWRAELGYRTTPDDFSSLIGADGMQSVRDDRTGRRAYVRLERGRLVAALYLSPDPVLVSRQWAVGLLEEADLTASVVLAGRPAGNRPDGGAIVCSCNNVGINTITEAITQHGCATVDAVGARTRAGTNCGSCRAEIRGVLDALERARETA
jgi:assimilatory nitrate reductase catalytic subunit